ncbi:hypothetical protein [Cryobacterium psychrotolerans]|nr:hypothetical protein [Cryobacterium psychrotolerans]
MTASTAPVPRAGLYKNGSVQSCGFELDTELHDRGSGFARTVR